MGELILAMNGPEHRQYRNLVAHTFRASVLERWDEELVRPVIDELLDRIAPLGHADLVHDVTSQYPVQVICGIVGVPTRGPRAVREVGRGDQHRARSTRQRGHGRVHARCARTSSRSSTQRRADPRGDLLSELVHAEVDGERLTDETPLRVPPPPAPGRAETTFRVMGNALRPRC